MVAAGRRRRAGSPACRRDRRATRRPGRARGRRAPARGRRSTRPRARAGRPHPGRRTSDGAKRRHDDDGDGAVGGARRRSSACRAPQRPTTTSAPTIARRRRRREAPQRGPMVVVRHARIVLAPVHATLTASPSPDTPRRTRRRGPRAPARSAPQPPRRGRRRRRGRARRCSPRRRPAGAAGRPRAPRARGAASTVGSIPYASSTSAAAVTGVAPSRSRAFDPAETRGGDLAGNDHHLTSVLEREVRRDQRSRALARLDDHGRGAETGDDPVPGREPPRRGLDARLVLRHDQPSLDDPAGKVAVRGRVVAVDAAAEHGDGDTADVERAAVRLAVDPPRHAADDDEPRRRQLAAERSRHGAAVRGARPRADDRDRGPGKQLRSAPHRGARASAVGRGSPAAEADTPSAHA